MRVSRTARRVHEKESRMNKLTLALGCLVLIQLASCATAPEPAPQPKPAPAPTPLSLPVPPPAQRQVAPAPVPAPVAAPKPCDAAGILPDEGGFPVMLASLTPAAQGRAPRAGIGRP